MKLTAADFLSLSTSLGAALVMTALGATAAHFSISASAQAAAGLASAERERNDFGRKLDRVRSEEDEIKQKSALFDELKRKGVIGPEQRLEWLELVKEIRDRRQLIDLRYELAPQRALDAKSGEGFAFYASSMKLNLQLLHEEDLTRLLSDLRERAHALIEVKSCSLVRLPQRASGTTRSLLRGECELDWITLREAPTPKEAR